MFDFRLKTIDVVIRNTKDAEDRLKSYETRLRDVGNVPSEEKELEEHRTQLKVPPLFSYLQCLVFALKEPVVTWFFSGTVHA